MAETNPQSPASGQGQKVTEELKGDAKNLADTALKQGEAKAKDAKDHVGRTAHSVSSAMQTAADEMNKDDEAPDWLASAFANLAGEVDSLASRLKNKSPRELATETRRFARDNPTAFLAASAAAGFAAARFLRAGAEYHDEPGSVGSDDVAEFTPRVSDDLPDAERFSTTYASAPAEADRENEQTGGTTSTNFAPQASQGETG